ncbi:Myocyte-specific enhancer factor 2A [Frankliniella fusca]|uniref:Myocyte-specific enhancer factor 2A n=1 Tax=Frankliniella fusca TaxID=407009 RepID=A0AAE1LG59_9NEOP|nr:Myocyte-specific enhancer factor 2A [Frankliniella fusca]
MRCKEFISRQSWMLNVAFLLKREQGVFYRRMPWMFSAGVTVQLARLSAVQSFVSSSTVSSRSSFQAALFATVFFSAMAGRGRLALCCTCVVVSFVAGCRGNLAQDTQGLSFWLSCGVCMRALPGSEPQPAASA